MSAERYASDREWLTTKLHEALDGDFLVGCGLGVGNEGENVAISEARPKEVVQWAVLAILGPRATDGPNVVAEIKELRRAIDTLRDDVNRLANRDRRGATARRGRS